MIATLLLTLFSPALEHIGMKIDWLEITSHWVHQVHPNLMFYYWMDAGGSIHTGLLYFPGFQIGNFPLWFVLFKMFKKIGESPYKKPVHDLLTSMKHLMLNYSKCTSYISVYAIHTFLQLFLHTVCLNWTAIVCKNVSFLLSRNWRPKPRDYCILAYYVSIYACLLFLQFLLVSLLVNHSTLTVYL